jgi:hypothetical protein
MSQSKTNERANAFVSRTGWYSIYYPPGWMVEESDESIAVYDPKHGVGALHISAYQTPGSVDPKSELIEHLSDNVPPVDEKKVQSFSSDSKNIASFEYVSDGSFHKIWFISDGCYLVLANYICDKEDSEGELGKIEDIIASVKVEPELSRN